MSILKLEHISKNKLGNGIQDCSFEVSEGSIFALFGEDDAGKTTLLNCIMKNIRPDEGVIERNYATIRFVPDNIIYEDLKIIDYLNLFLGKEGDSAVRQVEYLCEIFNINIEEKLLATTYEKNKLTMIIGALCSRPQLLLLDEPGNFLEDKTYQKLLGVLRTYNKAGMTIVITSDEANSVQHVCHEYAYMSGGTIVQTGKVFDMKGDWKVLTVCNGNMQLIEQQLGTPFYKMDAVQKYCVRSETLQLQETLYQAGCSSFLLEEMTFEEVIEKDFSRWLL